MCVVALASAVSSEIFALIGKLRAYGLPFLIAIAAHLRANVHD